MRETDDGNALVIRPKIVDAGHHSRRLMRLTGLDVQENQARRLLNDLDEHRAFVNPNDDVGYAAHQWLMKIFEPTVRAVPREYRKKLETMRPPTTPLPPPKAACSSTAVNLAEPIARSMSRRWQPNNQVIL